MTLCECGCGLEVKPGNRFINGHQSRGENNPFFGKHHTDEFKAGRMGEGNPSWHGGSHTDNGGYVRVLAKGHKRADTKGYVKEHTLIWMEHNGDVAEGYCIHHINGDKADNRIENLQMMMISEHNALGKIGNEYGRKYSNAEVLVWVELHRQDKLSYTKISDKVDVERSVVYNNVKKFEKRYPMPTWAIHQVVRESGLIENTCEHFIGHPHPASVAKFEKVGIMSMGIHGCDGCCTPGKREEIKRAYKEKWGDE